VNIFGWAGWRLRNSERIEVCNKALLDGSHLLIGITRVRNEALLLRDTLDFVGTHVDAIIAYDDASIDATLDILRSHPKVALVIANSTWESDTVARLSAETRHRGLLLQTARSRLKFEWAYCFDADERLIGKVRDFLGDTAAATCNGIRVQLFDAYMTPDDHAPFETGQALLGLRRFFGPERRDILMLWRNRPQVVYKGLDAREPKRVDKLVTRFHCQHYGKAISIAQWEETCDYYVSHFPFETYGRKWLERKGRAIHTQSDFSRPLFEWGGSLFDNAVVIS
jgi:hypothetical protein